MSLKDNYEEINGKDVSPFENIYIGEKVLCSQSPDFRNKKKAFENKFDIKSFNYNHNIDCSNYTRLMRYLFFTELNCFYPDKIVAAFFKLRRTVVEKENKVDFVIPNAYFEDSNRTDYTCSLDNSYFYYFITIDKRCPRFNQAWEIIKDMETLVEYYDKGTLRILVVNTFNTSRFRKMVKGDFATLYSESKYLSLTANWKQIVTYWTEFYWDDKSFEIEMTETVKELTGYSSVGNVNKAEHLIKEFNIDCDETKKLLRERHKDDFIFDFKTECL